LVDEERQEDDRHLSYSAKSTGRLNNTKHSARSTRRLVDKKKRDERASQRSQDELSGATTVNGIVGKSSTSTTADWKFDRQEQEQELPDHDRGGSTSPRSLLAVNHMGDRQEEQAAGALWGARCSTS